MLERVMVEAGVLGVGVSEWVRGAVEARLGVEERPDVVRELPVVMRRGEEAAAAVVVVGEEERVEVVTVEEEKEPVEVRPAWKVKLEMQMAEMGRGFVSSGSAAPAAVASVSAPSGEAGVAPGARYAPMRGRTPEEKAAALAKVGGLKLMPQMTKVDPYALGDPEPGE